MSEKDNVAKIHGNSHVPTGVTIEVVRTHAMVGTPQTTIAQLIGIGVETLRKHYREILDTSMPVANANVGAKLYQTAMRGNVPSMIFWLKTRAGWRENNAIALTGPNGEALPLGNAGADAAPDFSMLTPKERREVMTIMKAVKARQESESERSAD